MPDELNPVDGPIRTATAAEFVGELNRLHHWAGRPPYRTLHDQLSPSTVSDALRGKHLPRPPRLEFVEAFVGACLRFAGLADARVEVGVETWRQAWRRIGTPATPDTAAGTAAGTAGAAEASADDPAVAPAGAEAADTVADAPDGTNVPVASPRPEPTGGPYSRRGASRRGALLALAAAFLVGVVVGGATLWLVDPRDPPAVHASDPAPSDCLPADAPPPPGREMFDPAEDTSAWLPNNNRVDLRRVDKGVWRAGVHGGGIARPSDLLVIRRPVSVVDNHHYALTVTASASRPVTVRIRFQNRNSADYDPFHNVPYTVTPQACRRTMSFLVHTTTTGGELIFLVGGLEDFDLTLTAVSLVDQGPK
ncbi:hypothetical protein [Cryptosporangium sp. NPDC048952]|uniref:hypothetical protein n=1 Tax=Cryptosporangium sp. NPDC048952 TaxID=3363961 RepID=UPI0037205218